MDSSHKHRHSLWQRYRNHSISLPFFISVVLLLLALPLLPLTSQISPLKSPVAQAATADTLNFQGRLLTNTGGLVPDGVYNMEFNLYYVPTAGSTQWTETRLVSGTGVTVRNGYFSVYLGDQTTLPALDWSQDLYLGMTIRGTTNCAWVSCSPIDAEMTPRFKLTSVPYAFVSANVASSDTNAVSTNSDGISITTGDALGATSNSGNISVDVGTATGTAGTISLGSANATNVLIGSGSGTFSLQTSNIDISTAGVLSGATGITSSGTITFSGLNCTGNANGGALTANISGVISCSDDDGGAGGGLLTQGTGFAYLTTTTDNLVVGSATNNGGKLEVLATTEQLRLSYDASNNTTFTVSSGGDLTVTPSGGQLSLAGDLEVTAGNYLSLAGGNTASRPGSPTEGMVYFDSDTDSLLTYANGKWQSDRGEFIVVAANDSTQSEKDSADYVADGTDDQVQINAALTAGAGGKIILLAGTYVTHQSNNGDATIFIPNNTTLAGTGPGTKIEFADIDPTSDNLIENSDTTTGTGVIIRDLTLDGRSDLNTVSAQTGVYFNGMGAGTTRDGGQVFNVAAYNFTDIAIWLNASDNNSFFGNTISNNSTGIYKSSSDNNSFISNTIRNNTFTGVEFGGNNNIVSGNVIENNGGDGIEVNSGQYNVFSNNVISNNDYGYYNDCGGDYNRIQNNTINGNTNDGIYFDCGGNHIIDGNTLTGNGGSGIKIQYSDDNNIVSNNRVINSGGATENNGIVIFGAESITGNNITDNSCTTSCDAIVIEAVSDGAYLADNTYYTTAGTDQATIRDAGTNTRYANQQVAGKTLQSGSTILKAYGTQVLTGTIDPTASTTLTGVGTKFLTELQVGDRITVSAETRTVTAIASDTSLTVDTATTDTANDLTPDRLPAALIVKNSAGANTLVVNDAGLVSLGNSTLAGSLAISDGSSNTVTLLATATAGDYTLSIPTLTANDTICVVSGNCSGLGGLQASYDAGNTITTTNARDIDFTLADTATDSNFDIVVASGSTSAFRIYNDATLAVSYTTANGFSVPGGSGSEQFGLGATASSTSSIALGNNANAGAVSSIAIGASAGVINRSGSIAIGTSSSSDSGQSVVIGNTATSTAGNNGRTISLGYAADSTAAYGVAIGYASSAGLNSLSIGGNSGAAFTDSIAIGTNSLATANNQLILGGNSSEITDVYIGEGVTNATPLAVKINATGGSGTDIAGANLTVAGGRGTGSGTGGSLLFQTATAGATGSSLNALTTRLTIDQAGASTFAGTLAVNGNTLSTNQATFNLLNTTATTVNAFGAGTAITLGATTGTTSIRNALSLGTTAVAGSLLVSDGSSNTVTLIATATAGDYTLSIPTLTGNDTICVVGLNNCVGAGATSVGTLDTATTNAFGGHISAGVLYLQSATASLPGLVNNTTQTFSGNKTFTGTISSPGAGGSSEHFGAGSTSGGLLSLSLGNLSSSAGDYAVAIGYSSSATSTQGISILGSSTNGVSIGGSSSSANSSVTVGRSASSTTNAVSVGELSSTIAYGTAIGYNATVNGTKGIALGAGAVAGANQFVVGANNMDISSGYFGNGVTNGTPYGFTLNATGGSGTNIAGANLTVAGGRGTGTGTGGSLLFQTATAGGSGASLNALATRLTIDQAGLATFANNVGVTGTLTATGLSTFDGNLRISDGSSNYATINVSALASDYSVSIPTITANDTFCLGSGNCSGLGGLQASYTAGSAGDQIIALSTANDSLIFRNPASAGTDSGYVLSVDQLNTGAVDGLRINNAGTGNLLGLYDSGTLVARFADGGHLLGANTVTGTTGTTEATARTNVTTVTLIAAGSFANNDVIFINNAGQDYYTRIVSGGGTTTLTVSPAVSYDVSATVTKYNIQNIGATATDYATQANRFFQGYFLGGVVTGAGSTTLSDGNLSSTGNLVLQGTGGNVGIGIDVPKEKLHVNGFIRTETVDWALVHNTGCSTIEAMAEYNGNLYASSGGGGGCGGGKIYMFDGDSWVTKVTGAQEVISALAVYEGKLYYGLGSGTNNAIISVCDPTVTGDIVICDSGDWSVSGDPGAQNQVRALAVYDGRLFAGIGNTAGQGDIFEYDGSSWSSSYNGASSNITTFAVYNGKLYAGQGSGTAGDGDIFVYDGATWSLSRDDASTYESVSSLAVYNGKLYAGMGSGTDDGDVYAFDGTSWTQVYSSSGYESASSMTVYNGKLFVGFGNASNGDGDVLVYDGANWRSNFAGPYEVVASLEVFDGKLYAGLGWTINGDADIYVYNEPLEAQLNQALRVGETTPFNELAQNFTKSITVTTSTNTTSAFLVQNAAGTSVFNVNTSTAGVTVTGTTTSTGLLTGQAGLTVTGAAVNLNASSDFAVNVATGTSTGAVTIGGGSGTFALDSTNFDVTTAGALSGITTISTSSTINSQTISATANFTGTLTVQGASATLGVASTTTGSAIFRNAGGAGGITLTPADPGASSYTLTLPAETGTLCSTGSVCSGYQASGSYANTALSNLSSVAINTSLLPDTNDAYDLGSDTLRWRDIYLGGETVHLGTSTSDEATLGYNTTTNSLTLGTTNGGVVVKNTADSTAALQVQNAAGASILTVDTSTTANLLANPGIEVNTTGWALKGSSTVTRDTAEKLNGVASLKIATTAAAADGARFDYNFSTATTYTLSFYVKTTSTGGNYISIGRQEVSGSDIDCATGATVGNDWARINCTFTTGGTITSSNIYIKQSDTTARNIFIDNVQLEIGTDTTPYNGGGIVRFDGGIVQGVTSFTQGLAVGSKSGLSDRQLLTGSSFQTKTLLSVNEEITESNVYVRGINTNLKVNPSANSLGVMGLVTRLDTVAGNSNTIALLTGNRADVTNNQSGTVTTLAGNYVVATNSSTGGAVSSLYGSSVSATNSAGAGQVNSLHGASSSATNSSASGANGIYGSYAVATNNAGAVTELFGSNTYAYNNAGGGAVTSFIGSQTYAYNGSASSVAYGIGVKSFYTNSSSGTTTFANGAELAVHNSSTGTITNAVGGSFVVDNTSTGTITNMTGISVDLDKNAGTGNSTNVRGANIDLTVNGNATNINGIRSYITTSATSTNVAGIDNNIYYSGTADNLYGAYNNVAVQGSADVGNAYGSSSHLWLESSSATGQVAQAASNYVNASAGSYDHVGGTSSLTHFTGDASVSNVGYGTWGVLVVGSSATSAPGAPTLAGVYGTAANESTLTVPELIGVGSQLQNSSTGTITSGKGFHNRDPVNTGTITNYYGYYSEYLNNSTNNYPLYFAGSSGSILQVTGEGATTIKANGGSAVALTVNNHTSTGNIFVAQDNGTPVFTIADGGNATFASNLTVSGAIRSNSGFNINGTAGASTTCSGGDILQNQVVSGGITTGGSCVAAGGGGISGSGSADRVAYWSGASVLTSSANFLYNGSTLTVSGAIRSNSGFNINGTAGGTVSCGNNQYIESITVSGGILTAGSCQSDIDTDTDTNSGGTVTGTGVSGRVAYWNGTSSLTSTSNLLFDGSTLSLTGTLNVDSHIQLNLIDTANTNGVCHSGAASNTTAVDRYLVVCSATPNDYAEFYPAVQGVEAGDIVATTPSLLTYEAQGADAETGEVFSLGMKQISIINKAISNENVLGIISTAPYQTIGKDIPTTANRKPVALSGRVPVKVNNEGGSIKVGDRIALSTVAGVGRKATSSGMTVGVALEPFNGTLGSIVVYVQNSYFAGPINSLLQGSGLTINGNTILNGNTTMNGQTIINGNLNATNLTVTGTTQLASLKVTGITELATLKVTNGIEFGGKLTSEGEVPTLEVVSTVTGDAISTAELVAEVSGTDVAGIIKLVSQNYGGDPYRLKLIFSNGYELTPVMTLTPNGRDGALLGSYIEDQALDAVYINFINNPEQGKTYQFNYQIIQTKPAVAGATTQ